MTVNKLQETFRLVLKKLLSHKKGSEEPNRFTSNIVVPHTRERSKMCLDEKVWSDTVLNRR